MTLSLSAVQRLLVLSALAWVVLPIWGGFAFAASWLLLAFGSRNRTRRARALLDANLEPLKLLPEDGLALARRFPLAYVWPNSAQAWGTTWQMTALLALLLAVVFAVWALLTWTAWYLLLILPLLVVLGVGVTQSRALKIAERVQDDLKEHRVLHGTVMSLLRLKMAAGQWPPEPSPDPAQDERGLPKDPPK